MKDLTGHLSRLKLRHAKLDRDIETISTCAFVNETKLHEMKKVRLKIKEEIDRFSRSQNGAKMN